MIESATIVVTHKDGRVLIDFELPPGSRTLSLDVDDANTLISDLIKATRALMSEQAKKRR